jgi:hypothetical protein
MSLLSDRLSQEGQSRNMFSDQHNEEAKYASFDKLTTRGTERRKSDSRAHAWLLFAFGSPVIRYRYIGN